MRNLTKEAGGHRIQRVPPTEKRGRVHTSTVTVAVLDSNVKVDNRYLRRELEDFQIEWFSGTGKGGQHRNRHKNSCRVIHTPTGITEARQGKERESNKKLAFDAINKRLDELMNSEAHGIQSDIKKDQVGSGMRGDKIRTIRFQDNQVKDHRTGKTIQASRFMKGHIKDIW